MLVEIIKKNKIAIISLATFGSLFLIALFITEHIDGVRKSLIDPISNGTKDTTSDPFEDMVADISNEVYEIITTNVKSLESKPIAGLGSEINEWVRSLLKSDLYTSYSNRHTENSFLAIVSYGQPLKPEQDSSRTWKTIDYPIKNFGVEEKNGEWWLRLVFSANEGVSSNYTIQETSSIPADNAIYKRLAASKRYAVAGNAMLNQTELRDPTRMGVGIEHAIPYTYISSVEQSAVYLESLFLDGWNIERVESGAYYLDYYLKKNIAESRVIILDGSLKVFYWGTQR
ncbi:hypothetical protein [Paenibacillus sinopodophylli]|uniref:hypothetical protein n=1 Tax=Paenibacillus sinopodophylli TaxID=1837342 RepID=UPI00110CC088|nr:hypothetical protein [Paenibacillus sinopodophylli]